MRLGSMPHSFDLLRTKLTARCASWSGRRAGCSPDVLLTAYDVGLFKQCFRNLTSNVSNQSSCTVCLRRQTNLGRQFLSAVRREYLALPHSQQIEGHTPLERPFTTANVNPA